VQKNYSSIPVRRRPPVRDIERRESAPNLKYQTSVDVERPESASPPNSHQSRTPASAADPAAAAASLTPISLRTGDGGGVNAAAELPIWRLKDVYIDAITLDREIRMFGKRIDPKSREELTRIIEICRQRLLQANRSATAASHAEGSAACTAGHVKPSGIPISIAARSQPSLLRQPAVRAAGDASTKFRLQH